MGRGIWKIVHTYEKSWQGHGLATENLGKLTPDNTWTIHLNRTVSVVSRPFAT